MRQDGTTRRTRIRHTRHAAAAALAALGSMAVIAGCAPPPTRSADRVERIEAVALLQTLNADLLSHDSATLTLERWCAEHHLASPARIVARLLHGQATTMPDELRRHLELAPDEPLGYRHVQLVCGERVLSEADNWYVPARLTDAMNRALDTSDEPFGKVVRPLGFERRTLSSETLWLPLPSGWELAGTKKPEAYAGPLQVPAAVLRHTAVLYDAQRRPFSVVVETYTNQLFAFGEWLRLLAPP